MAAPINLDVQGTGGAGGDAGPSRAGQTIGGFYFGDRVFGDQGIPGWVIGLVVIVIAWIFLRKKQ